MHLSLKFCSLRSEFLWITNDILNNMDFKLPCYIYMVLFMKRNVKKSFEKYLYIKDFFLLFYLILRCLNCDFLNWNLNLFAFQHSNQVQVVMYQSVKHQQLFTSLRPLQFLVYRLMHISLSGRQYLITF